jgi:hypothetical protein
MSNIDLLSSKILSNKDILIDLYSIVKQAAIDATTDESVISQKNNVCVLPYNIDKITRMSPEHRCVDSIEAEIIYEPDALTVFGGAALNLYDFELQEFKTRKDIPELQSFIKKSTSDLDMVWWPKYTVLNPSLSNMCAISQSTAIEVLAKVFREKLINRFNSLSTNSGLLSKISTILGGQTNVNVSLNPVFPAGVWNVQCIFISNNINYKIIEIAIHDTASGQRLDRYGNYINTLLPMNIDPVYSTLQKDDNKSITQLHFNDKKVSVCNIIQFINQQIFAFSLLIKDPNMSRASKSLINYKRIIFIMELLNNIQKDNSRNIELLKSIFDIHTYNERSRIITNIIYDITSAIRINSDIIIKMCNNISERDPMLNELYYTALNEKLRDVMTEYDNKKRVVEFPLRDMKRSKKRMSNAMKQDIIQKVKVEVDTLDNKYNNELQNIRQQIDIIKDNMTSMLTIKEVPSVNISINTKPINTKPINTKLNNTRKNNKKAPLLPLPSPISQSSTSQSSLQQPQQYSIPAYNPPVYSDPSYTPYSQTATYQLPSQPQYTHSLSREQIINGSRLIYDPYIKSYKLYDVLHNTFIEVMYNTRLNQYVMNEPYYNNWIPIYYDNTTGKYFPVYYYSNMNSYAIYNDISNMTIPVEYNKQQKRFIIKSLGYKGGVKTRKNNK